MQGTVVYEAGPYWKVAQLSRGRYVVVDTSVTPPVLVDGPMSRANAEASARVSAGLWAATHGQVEG